MTLMLWPVFLFCFYISLFLFFLQNFQFFPGFWGESAFGEFLSFHIINRKIYWKERQIPMIQHDLLSGIRDGPNISICSRHGFATI